MHVLAVDTLSPDPTGAAVTELPVHRVVLGADALIVENLCRLGGIAEHVRIGLFPLPIDADGAPVRAVAFLP
jgi:kynurenine formamidase